MKWKIEAIIIALGIFLCGNAIKNGIKSFTENSRTIEVRGLSEKEVKADRATWNITFNASGDNLKALYTQIKQTEETIVEFLHSNKIDDKDIYGNPASVYDKMNDRYLSDSNKAPRYNVTKTITVSTSNVDAVYQTVNKQEQLLAKGIVLVNEYNSINYEFTGLNSIKPTMIEEATKAAREAADKFAKDSESKLGKIQTARQGQFSISDRDTNTPYIKKVRVVTYINYYLKD